MVTLFSSLSRDAAYVLHRGSDSDTRIRRAYLYVEQTIRHRQTMMVQVADLIY
jgi:hypothetical protein